MADKAQELFAKLVDQIQLNEQERQHPLIQQGRIDKVVVHQQSRLWEFHLGFTEILPVMLYQSFMQQLELAFQQIAGVSVKISADKNDFTEEQLTDYWQLALLNSQCDTPLVQRVIKTQTPVIEDKKIILPVDNDAVIPYLKQQYLPIIEELYSNYGFQKFHIEPKMDEQQAKRVLALFEERKQEQDAAFQQQAAESLIKHEQKKKQQQQQGPALEGPIRLGRNIPNDEPIIRWAIS